MRSALSWDGQPSVGAGDWGAMRAMEIGRGEMIYFLGCVSHAIYTPMVRRLNRGVPHPPSDSSAISFRSSCGAANTEALGVRSVPLSLRWIDPPLAARSASIERDGGMAHGRPLRSLAGGCAHFL